jgi:hypothetical protein
MHAVRNNSALHVFFLTNLFSQCLSSKPQFVFLFPASFPFSVYLAIGTCHAPLHKRSTTQPHQYGINRRPTDCDTIDSTLGEALRMFFATFANIIGAIILVAVILPWFLIAVVCILVMYVYFAAFYRASAREIKVRRPQ